MAIASIRYAAPAGGIKYRIAVVLSTYPALDSMRVQFCDTGEIRHINPRSVAWFVTADEVAA
jgi:hypothetical protein